jgi:hypothetical protein
MPGTVTSSEITYSKIRKVTFDWLADAGGDATGATAGGYTGEIVRAIMIPDGPPSQPDDAYDVVITDSDGVDVLGGQGANLSHDVTVHLTGTTGPLSTIVATRLAIAVSGAGAAHGGLCILYVR